MQRHWLRSVVAPIWRTVYNEGQGTGTQGGSEGGQGGSEGGQGGGSANGGTGTAGGGGEPPAAGKTYTQAELDGIVAKERRKLNEQNQATIKQLEEMKKLKGLTDKEKSDLALRIEELQNQSLTKEELAAKEREKLQNQYKTEKEQLTQDRDRWQSNFTKATIHRTITDAAVSAEAVSPKQIVNLLKTDARLVEKTDNEGNIIPDEYVVKIKMDTTDKEGKPIILDLTPEEAMKVMKDKTDEYGNLFKSSLAGGLGGNTGKASKPKNPADMNHDDYLKHRGSLGLGSAKG